MPSVDSFDIAECNSSRPKFLMLVDWYLPGYKSGGPVRTIANVVERFGDEYDIKIVTRDRDAGDAVPYRDIERDQWTQVGKAKICYVSAVSLRRIRKCIRDVNPHVIYLNSFFSKLTRAILLLRFLRLVPAATIVMAPRGEFSPAALKIKAVRKRLYLLLCTKTRMLDSVLWQASSGLEKEQISREAGANAKTHLASDLKTENIPATSIVSRRKHSGSARFVFLSRISPMKNLEQALHLMAEISGRAEFHIYGPIEDRKYWQRCEQAISRLPASVQVCYCGSVPHHQTVVTMSQYDFFVLPTLGENFGHAIFEALAAGCPVLISDRTPWTDLVREKAGWALPPDDQSGWKAALRACVDMEQLQYEDLSSGARQAAQSWITMAERAEETRTLFKRALSLRRENGHVRGLNA